MYKHSLKYTQRTHEDWSMLGFYNESFLYVRSI